MGFGGALSKFKAASSSAGSSTSGKGISPSGGMLKKMFDPSTLKKKMKTSMGVAKPGGPGIKTPAMPTGGAAKGKMRLINKG